jgi:hypothetical protein
VDGRWRAEEGELALTQQFQMISGSITSGNVVSPIANGKMAGTRSPSRPQGRPIADE